MKKKQIAAILAREVDRLDELSKRTGLSLDDLRALELLLKANRALLDSLPDDSTPPPTGPQPPATLDLLAQLHASSTGDTAD